jgi:hypothetical protein
MKNLAFGLCFAVMLIASACQKDNVLLPTDVQTSIHSRDMVSISGSPYFSARHTDVEAETWNGRIDEGCDCAPPEKDCVVITPSMITGSSLFQEYDGEISQGDADELYSTGSGNQVMELKSGACSDLQTGAKNFYKHTTTGENLYIFR